MRKIIVLQHVAHEPLGTLNPLLKDRGFRIRYVNFGREHEAHPRIDSYNGLIILGGPMGVYHADRYPHLKYEMKLIEQALKMNIPVLGICLGSQLLAHVLGGAVRKSQDKEIGWYDVHLTKDGENDSVMGNFKKTEKIFQLHGDSFEVPANVKHLAYSELCVGQAFRYGEKVYGFQFHLEVDQPMIHRWLQVADNKKDLAESKGKFTAKKIESDTGKYIENSLQLSHKTFTSFIDLFGLKERPEVLGSGHGN